MIVQREASFSG